MRNNINVMLLYYYTVLPMEELYYTEMEIKGGGGGMCLFNWIHSYRKLSFLLD